MLPLRIFGIPVRINWSVAILAILGIGVYDGFALVMFTFGVVAAVLLHELGHAFTARRFGGSDIMVTLYAFGGLTTFQPGVERPMSSFRLFLVAAAGSATGIITGGALFLLIRNDVLTPRNVDIEALAWGFILAGLIWGALNWLPIGPLDGAHMLRHFLAATVPSRAASIARTVSIIVGAATVIVAISLDQLFLAVIAGVMTVSTLSEPAPASRPRAERGDSAPDDDEESDPPVVPEDPPAADGPPVFPI
ncbi:MAG: hypothetical protein KJP12_06135 [Acidimicrobiia bacterium]|nr:hypothetical protein [Acidimicrobiia bacterium]NNK91772.1 hypothetical protein [Acidimicrobiia bacterium]